MPRRDIRVALVDDKELFYVALQRKLKHIAGARSVFYANSRKALRQKLDTCSPLPDIVLMDIQLAVDENGFECTQWLREHYPQIRVVGYSDYPHAETIQRLINCGARAFIEKGLGAESLRMALFDVHESGYHFNQFIPDDVFLEAAQRLVLDDPAKITGTLQQIMMLCATDLTAAQIGEVVFLGERAVKNYIGHLCRYFGVKTTKAMVAQAFWQGLMPNRMPDQLRETIAKVKATIKE
ncbi:response regulator [Parapedobacter deserti]|uniref:Response regulator n=1 Tax=Parapedobacter deserti TaxID=1912957 RepID=A0ABV7JJT1_9SPHI